MTENIDVLTAITRQIIIVNVSKAGLLHIGDQNPKTTYIFPKFQDGKIDKPIFFWHLQTSIWQIW